MLKTKNKRSMFVFDLTEDWKRAFEERVLPNYKAEKTTASLARRIFQEIVSCFMTESEMRHSGLLPPDKSLGKPDALMFAIRNSEHIRREEGSGVHSIGQAVGHGAASAKAKRSG